MRRAMASRRRPSVPVAVRVVGVWVIAAGVTAVTVAAGVLDGGPAWTSVVEAIGQVGWLVLPVVYVFTAALIVSRQPGNVVGWLLVPPAVAVSGGALVAATLERAYPPGSAPPTELTPGLVAAIVVDNFAWMALIFPLLHLLLVFPTGQVLPGRWRWLVRLEVAMVTFLGVAAFLTVEVGPIDGSWRVPNPVGFIPESFFGPAFFVPWSMGLVALSVGGAAATVVRYRRALVAERLQLKWLLFAFSVFAVSYSVLQAINERVSGAVFDLVLVLPILFIPVALAVAVLRHRLFDIDVIIRRTLVYAVVTGLLGATYAGSVVLLRALLGDFLGDGSWRVAVSTLLAAALFAPVRGRAQRVVDRRFFRSRYDAGVVVARVADDLRGSLDLAEVTGRVESVVDEVFAPVTVGVWVADEHSRAG